MHLRGIDTNLVVALHALLTQQNVTRAARQMGLSQSSMSHALGRLRSHFDDPLLVQVGRKLVLSERGEALVEPVADVVGRLEGVFSPRTKFDPATSKRTFKIAATDNLELYVLPRLTRVLAEQAPGIALKVSALSEDWALALERGDVDLKLGRRWVVAEPLESQDLSHEEFACVARAGHPIKAHPTLEQYARCDHLLVAPTAPPSAPTLGTIDAALAKHKLRRRVRMVVPHFLVAPFTVAASDLLLTAPARLLEPFVSLLGLRRIALPLKVPGYQLGQIWASRMRSDPGHRWLRSEIAKIFA